MKALKRKFAVGMVALSAIVVPAFAYATGSSYSISYSFDSNLTGQTRNFTGSNIGVDLNSSYDGPYPTTNTFTVKLYRSNTFIDDFIGSGTAPSNGWTTIKWSSVGAGDYYLTMSHSPYGFYVNGTGTMYNY